jgi:outer membrane protein assembly factor BamB
MAYDPNNLSALTYANGFTLWHYKTPDAADAVDTTGYFNDAAGMLRVGDFVFANTGTMGGVFVVNANAGGVVDVANITDFASGDTD